MITIFLTLLYIFRIRNHHKDPSVVILAEAVRIDPHLLLYHPILQNPFIFFMKVWIGTYEMH
jgi:hypothetical protein